MTRPKFRPCPNCQWLNQANRKTCQSCYDSLSLKKKLREKEDFFKDGQWGQGILKNRNAARVVDSARIMVRKLEALGYMPILFLGKHGKTNCVAEVVTCMSPQKEGHLKLFLEKMTRAYEFILRNYEKVQAPPVTKTLETAASQFLNPPPGEETYVLNLVPDPLTATTVSSPASTSYCVPAASLITQTKRKRKKVTQEHENMAPPVTNTLKTSAASQLLHQPPGEETSVLNLVPIPPPVTSTSLSSPPLPTTSISPPPLPNTSLSPPPLPSTSVSSPAAPLITQPKRKKVKQKQENRDCEKVQAPPVTNTLKTAAANQLLHPPPGEETHVLNLVPIPPLVTSTSFSPHLLPTTSLSLPLSTTSVSSPAPSSNYVPAAPLTTLPKRKRMRQTGKQENKVCRKCSRQKLFHFEQILERRMNEGKAEVKVRWLPCSACGKDWDDTWEPASVIEKKNK
ncbi:mucin-2-like [Trichomycterus rosablanca]|uniref:mucin-2-like n=1 Tax=Trichomycterus rosablanca TaxID=2290929 RepID=UPI002F35E0A9